MDKIQTPSCMMCKDFLWYLERETLYDHGVRINGGDQLCCYGKYAKRARKFKGSNPKQQVPCWCPKRKTPHEVRVCQ